MTVKGLMPGLLEIGKVKIGIKGKEVPTKDGTSTFRLPQKIDHFRIVKNERDEEDNYVIDDEIMEIISKNPSTVYDKEGNIVGIPIRLLYNEIDLNFPTQYVSYVAGKLSCSGNGEKAHTRDGRETKCPCARLEGAYTGKDKCKISGTLSCIIEGSNVGGCYKFRTTSINSARYILSSLMLIKAATGGLLSFIPLRLVINPKKTIIPATGAPTTIYVVTVEFQGGIEELQQKALTMGRERVSLIENMRDIEVEARNIVSNGTDTDRDREEREFAEEFFPDSIDVESQEVVKETPPAAAAKAKKTAAKKKPADDLLGEAVETKEEPEPEPEVVKTDEINELRATAAANFNPLKEPTRDQEKITRDQLKIILDLKANVLKINDPQAWAALIKQMKFNGVTKANGMTAEQGDKFIEHLKGLESSPT